MKVTNLNAVRATLRVLTSDSPLDVQEWVRHHLVDFWIYRAQLLLQNQQTLQLSGVYEPLRALSVLNDPRYPLNSYQQADLYREQLCRIGVIWTTDGVELDLINQHYFQQGLPLEPNYDFNSALNELVTFLTAVYRQGGSELLVQVDPYHFHQAVVGFRTRG